MFQARYRDSLARRQFPVYGLDESWIGTRSIGGSGASGDKVTRIELAHGDVRDVNAPLVRVDTRHTTPVTERDPNTYAPLVTRSLARSLVQHLWRATGIYVDAIPSTFQSDDPTGLWERTHLPVDAEPTEFSFLRAGSEWVALGAFADAIIGLQSRNVDPSEVRLITIEDPTPYLRYDEELG